MSVVYVDFTIVPVDGDIYVSEFTWLEESNNALVPHHYFIDYPGAKDLDRLLTDVVGGNPFVRYSFFIVLKAFSTAVPASSVVACKTAAQKELLIDSFMELGVAIDADISTFDDVIDGSNELSHIIGSLENTRTKAASRFGNSL